MRGEEEELFNQQKRRAEGIDTDERAGNLEIKGVFLRALSLEIDRC